MTIARSAAEPSSLTPSPERPDIVGVGAGAAPEGGGSRDQRGCARADRLSRRFGVDAAIDFELDLQTLLGDAVRDRFDLGQLAGNELLPAEAGIHGHHQHEIELLEHIVERLGGRRGVEGDAGLLAQGLHPLDRAVEVRPGLGMDGDDVGAGFGEGVEERIDRRNHEVNVERLGGVRPKRLHHRRTDRQVGHEMAVHDVDVDPVGAGLIDRAHFLAEPGEVRGEDRGRDDGHGAIKRV